MDRHYENSSFVESLISTSLQLFRSHPQIPILENLKFWIFKASKQLFNERFQTFSIIQINDFNFTPAKLRIYWQFEAVFSLLIHLCTASSLCATKVIFLYFEHFDLLFKFFEDVFLLLNFQKIKQFETKQIEQPTKSRLGGFFKSFRNMLTTDVPVESENEIFIKQKHRGNITAKNKNSHLLRNFISAVAPDFSAFKSILDGLQFVCFGIGNIKLADEILTSLNLHDKDLCTFLNSDLFGHVSWLKSKKHNFIKII
jgi:hypothetical protein